jgi:hypothetical protein
MNKRFNQEASSGSWSVGWIWDSCSPCLQQSEEAHRVLIPSVLQRGAAVFLAYGLLDLLDRLTLPMHVSGVQSYVLTNAASGTVLVAEAEQIVLVSKTRHASAETRQLRENLRNVLRSLVGSLRPRILRKITGRHCGDESRPRLGKFLASSCEKKPGDQCKPTGGTKNQPERASLLPLSCLLFGFHT